MEPVCMLIIGMALSIVMLAKGAGDVHAAPANQPVFKVAADRERVSQLEESVKEVLVLSEDELVALVPDRTGFYYLKCANCTEGTHESQLVWLIDSPNHMTCKYCGSVFPDKSHPENQASRLVNPLGIEVEYPYWEDEAGYRFFFSARAWHCARFYLSERARDLGELYQMTGNCEYSRRTALILEAFARYYPGYLVCYDEVHLPKAFHAGPPFPRRGGKWGQWRYDEIPTDLVFAYDSINGSGETERISKDKGTDVRHMIEHGFFMGGVRQDAFHGPLFTNASPGTYEGYAVLGRVLGDGELVHIAVRRIREFVSQWFFVDGFWRECSMSYHRYTLVKLQRALNAIEGYSDPVGFVDPVDGTRFDSLSVEREFPVVKRAKAILDLCRYPDGRPITVHDSWSKYDDVYRNAGRTGVLLHLGPVPHEAKPVLLTGAGHGWLGFGQDAHQFQAHLHYSDNQFGHTHADMLNLILFGHGEELLPDVGYSHSRYRQWTTGTLCHNTVLIDETEQFKGTKDQPGDGQLLAFESNYRDLQWIEAEGERSYPGLAQEYRRGLLLVRLGDDACYVVDLFSVHGGERHDWVLHGSADKDAEMTANIPMDFYSKNMLPGVDFSYPLHERDAGEAQGRNPSYGFFQNVNRGELTYDAVINTSIAGSRVGLKSHLPGIEGADLFLGTAPSIRRAEENDDRLDEFSMPIALVRRQGTKPLSSEYIAVHEPFDGQHRITQVTSEANPASGRAVVLKIEHNSGVDWVVRNLDRDSRIQIGDLCLEGNLGFVREREGKLVAMGMLDGKVLSWKKSKLAGPGTYSGVIRGVLRKSAGHSCNALAAEGGLPEGEAFKGGTVIARFGDGSTLGYRVEGIVSEGDISHILLREDPGLEVYKGGARHLFCPRYDIPGEMTFEIRATGYVAFVGGKPMLGTIGPVSFAAE